MGNGLLSDLSAPSFPGVDRATHDVTASCHRAVDIRLQKDKRGPYPGVTSHSRLLKKCGFVCIWQAATSDDFVSLLTVFSRSPS